MGALSGGQRPHTSEVDDRWTFGSRLKTRGLAAITEQGIVSAPSDTVEQAERLRLSFAREERRLRWRDLRAELVCGALFVAASVALLALAPGSRPFSPSLAAPYVVALAVATSMRFEVGAGYMTPIALVLVPMLFALPPAAVPALTVAATALGMLVDGLRGRVGLSRLLVVPANCWFVLGPAAVLAVAGAPGPAAPIVVLAGAFAAQLACDFTGNLAAEALRGEISVRELVRELRTVYAIDLGLSSIGLVVAFAAEHRPWAVLLIAPLFALLSVFSAERRIRMEQIVELHDAYRGTALVLGDVVEADDAYTGEHTRGVVALALDVADQLGLDRRARRLVEFGALLHDVGKVAVPKEIINKPGKLDAHEWAIIKTHTIEGQRMLDKVGGIMRDVGRIVRASHERWDGRGYPDGAAGDSIPLEARIVCCCDAFNAMTTTRSYRAAMPLEAAIAELRANAGTQFDPRVVAAVVSVLYGASTKS
jgi:putative nucleotidyltransferase with HDIG domain